MASKTDGMKTQDDLTTAVHELRREHPSLPQRLLEYRHKRSAYEAKRMAGRTGAVAPARQGAQRELRG